MLFFLIKISYVLQIAELAMKIIKFVIYMVMIVESLFGVSALDNISLQNEQHGEGVSPRKELRDLRKSKVLEQMSTNVAMNFSNIEKELILKMNNFYNSIVGYIAYDTRTHKINQESLRKMSNQLDSEYNELEKDIELEEQNLAAIKEKLDFNREWSVVSNTQILLLKRLHDKSISNNIQKLKDIKKMINATQEHINDAESYIQSIKTQMKKYKMIPQNEQTVDEKIIFDNYQLFFFIDITIVPIWSKYKITLTNIQYIISMIQKYNQEYNGVGAKIDELMTKLFANSSDDNKPDNTGRDYLQRELGKIKTGIEELKNRTTNISTYTPHK